MKIQHLLCDRYQKFAKIFLQPTCEDMIGGRTVQLGAQLHRHEVHIVCTVQRQRNSIDLVSSCNIIFSFLLRRNRSPGTPLLSSDWSSMSSILERSSDHNRPNRTHKRLARWRIFISSLMAPKESFVSGNHSENASRTISLNPSDPWTSATYL